MIYLKKVISGEEAEELFGTEIKTAANEAAEAFLVSPKGAEKEVLTRITLL